MCACVHVPACASARMRRMCVRALDSRQWAAPASDPPERAGVGRHAAYVRGTCPRQRPPSPRLWGRALGAPCGRNELENMVGHGCAMMA